jgi:heme-degrading monooxygenase HmoA
MTVSLTIIKYRKRFIPFGFLAMALFRVPLWLGKRSNFWKLMGSGKGGTFSKKPDFTQWAILNVSSKNFKHIQLKNMSAELAISKLYGSFINKWLTFFKCDTTTYLLDPVEGHGFWDGKKAFGDLPSKTDYEGAIAVLTRATIRSSKQKQFWAHVDGVAQQMKIAPGFITSYGVGEVPYFKQATFSIWETKAHMKAFAYGSDAHKDVIVKTRKEDWYSEDMFTRFKIDGCITSNRSYNPLKGKL